MALLSFQAVPDLFVAVEYFEMGWPLNTEP